MFFNLIMIQNIRASKQRTICKRTIYKLLIGFPILQIYQPSKMFGLMNSKLKKKILQTVRVDGWSWNVIGQTW